MSLRNRDTCLREVLDKLDIDPLDVETLLQEHGEYGPDDHLPEHMLELIASYQQNSWLAVDYANGVTSTKTGCGAGVPLASVVACMSLSRFIKRANLQQREGGIGVQVTHREVAELFCLGEEEARVVTRAINCSIMDDDTLLHLCEPSQVVHSIETMSSVVFDAYHASGLKLHLVKRKTAILISWNGTL